MLPFYAEVLLTKKDWKSVAVLVALILVLKLAAMLLGIGEEQPRTTVDRLRSTRLSSARSVEQILAYEQVGGPPGPKLVIDFRIYLDHIASQCDWTRREASDKLLRMHQILRREGKRVELLDLTIGLDRASRDVATDCHELLATLGAMVGR